MICSSSKSGCFYLQDIFQREPLLTSRTSYGPLLWSKPPPSLVTEEGLSLLLHSPPGGHSPNSPQRGSFLSETLMQLRRGIAVRSPSDASLPQSTRPFVIRPLAAFQSSPLPSLATSCPSLSTLHLGDFASAVSLAWTLFPLEIRMAPSLTSLRSPPQCPSSERLPVDLPNLTHLAILFPDSASLYHDLTDVIPFYLVCVWLVSFSTTKNVNSWRAGTLSLFTTISQHRTHSLSLLKFWD